MKALARLCFVAIVIVFAHSQLALTEGWEEDQGCGVAYSRPGNFLEECETSRQIDGCSEINGGANPPAGCEGFMIGSEDPPSGCFYNMLQNKTTSSPFPCFGDDN